MSRPWRWPRRDPEGQARADAAVELSRRQRAAATRAAEQSRLRAGVWRRWQNDTGFTTALRRALTQNTPPPAVAPWASAQARITDRKGGS